MSDIYKDILFHPANKKINRRPIPKSFLSVFLKMDMKRLFYNPVKS